jgi:RNA polymerase sigma-70 factor (ECF subfamily)
VEAARREPERFEALYRKYVGQVYSYAVYETRDHHLAEDLTEQTFLRALDALPRFEERGEADGSTFRVWLFQIARNQARNEHRRRARHPQSPLDAAADIAAPDDPVRVVTQRDTAATAWRAVQALPEDRRRAIVLRFVNELSTAEIAAVMGRSEGAVRVLIHRGLRSVAERFAGPDPRPLRRVD